MGQELINLGFGSGSAQHITSLEIAKVTGKMHKNLMRDIKTSEEAWHKVAGLKFELGSYLDAQNQKRPCYILTWPEALFIATKFNDEARARLVLRWMELEQAEKERIKAQIAENAADADYARLVLQSKGTLTATQIAKEMEMSAMAMNRKLHEMGVIFKQSGEWQLYAQYHGQGYVDKETLLPDGCWRCPRRIRWTEQGHRFLNEMIRNHKVAPKPRVKWVQLTIEFEDVE